MNVDVFIHHRNGATKARALLDSGAQVNIISQHLVKQLGLPESPRPSGSVVAINGAELFVFGEHQLRLQVSDTAGQARDTGATFVAATIEGDPLVLGYSWIRKYRPVCDWPRGTWRWPIGDQIEVIEAEDFVELVQERQPKPVARLVRVLSTIEPVFYAAYIREVSQVNRNLPPRRIASTTQVRLPAYLRLYSDVFSSENAGVLPENGKYDHAIDVEPGKEPPHGPLYNLSQTELKVLREYLEESANKGWIRRSISPAGAPILFVPKKDGTLRLCVDYRGLNAVTIKNRHALPLISETLDRLQGSVVYTKFDLKDAYHRIRIKAGDEWKTAFRTRYGHFEYMVMPFGLANAPATFQGYISQALVGLVDIICVIYLDDILIYSTSVEQHRKDVVKVVERLRQYKLYANLAKCEFETTEVDFLGFRVGVNGVSIDPRRIASIVEWPEPTTFRELQQFLGFANFFRKFILHYSKVVSPMTNLLVGMEKGKKTGPFIFPGPARDAFGELKTRFTTAPVLRHFDPTKRCLMETDASGGAIGGLVSQQNPGEADGKAHWHPIAFYSRKMIPAERNYPTHDGELLAIVECFKHWRHYLEGAVEPTLVKTDHAGLRFFMTTKKDLNRRQARWTEVLSQFDFEIVYRTGKSNPADGLSRRPDYMVDNGDTVSMLPTLREKLKGAFAAKALRFREVRGPLRRVFAAWTARKAPEDYGPASIATKPQGAIEPTYRRESASPATGWRREYDGAPTELPVDPLEARAENEPLTSDDSEGDDCVTVEPAQRAQGKREHDTSSDETPSTTQGAMLHVPRLLVSSATRGQAAYDAPLPLMREIILATQELDPFVQKEQWKKDRKPWNTDAGGLLHTGGCIYIPPSPALRKEIMRTQSR